jgi:thiol-disulfide isomerase/thioredoxin
MKKLLIIACMAVSVYGFGQKNTEITKLDQLQKLIATRAEGILVVNFWATWCAPCVKELPLFEKLHAEGKPGISVALVSMDLDIDPNPEKVYKFVERKGIKSRVLLLDEKDPNSWISSIDPAWSGALPATIVINQKTGKRKFVESSLHEGDLEKLIAEVQ